MKRILLIFCVVFVLLFASCSSKECASIEIDDKPITVGEPSVEDNFVWIIEPVYEYNSINICWGCNPLRSERPEDQPTTGISEEGDVVATVAMSEVLDLSEENVTAKLIEYNYIGTEFEGNIILCGVHGANIWEYYYDENKEIFVLYNHSDGGSFLYFHTLDEINGDAVIFNRHFNDRLNPVQKIDSDKIKTIGEPENEWYDLSEAVYGKFAVINETEFITDFIYDFDVSSAFGYTKRGDDAIAVILDGKHGVIGKNGETAINFIFGDINFIDGENAFAKYNGKYGILDVKQTIDNQ